MEDGHSVQRCSRVGVCTESYFMAVKTLVFREAKQHGTPWPHWTCKVNLWQRKRLFCAQLAILTQYHVFVLFLSPQGLYDQALEDCEKALQLNEGNYRALYRKARALKELGRHQEAYEAVAKCSLAVPQVTSNTLYPNMSKPNHIFIYFFEIGQQVSIVDRLAIRSGMVCLTVDVQTGYIKSWFVPSYISLHPFLLIKGLSHHQNTSAGESLDF